MPTQPGGAAAEASSKSKQLRLRTNIDDHMMSIKVRQASEMTAKGNDVNITVRLPSKQLKQLISSAALSEEQKLAMQKVGFLTRLPYTTALSLDDWHFLPFRSFMSQVFKDLWRHSRAAVPKRPS